MPFSTPEFDGCCGIDFLHQGQMGAREKSQNMPFSLLRIQNTITLKRCNSSGSHVGLFKNETGSVN